MGRWLRVKKARVFTRKSKKKTGCCLGAAQTGSGLSANTSVLGYIPDGHFSVVLWQHLLTKILASQKVWETAYPDFRPGCLGQQTVFQLLLGLIFQCRYKAFYDEWDITMVVSGNDIVG